MKKKCHHLMVNVWFDEPVSQGHAVEVANRCLAGQYFEMKTTRIVPVNLPNLRGIERPGEGFRVVPRVDAIRRGLSSW